MTVVDEIKTDSEAGTKRLESEYKVGLMAFARRFCHDEAEAEELVYRTFAEVVAGIDGYTEKSAFFGWMCKILSNCHANDIRRRSNQRVVSVGELPETPDDGDLRVVEEVDAALLREAIEELPAKLKEAVLLRYFADMPVLQIARFLMIPVGTVHSRLHMARIALAMRLGATLKKRPIVAMIAAAALFLAASAAVVVAVSTSESSTGRARSPSAPQPTGETPDATVSAVESSIGGAASPLAAVSTARTGCAPYQSAESSTTSTSTGEDQMNTNKVKSALLGIAAATSAALPFAANADPSVTIDSVVQRWPWNNKVDITYTVTGGQTRSAGLYCGLRFAVSANGASYDFQGYTLGASAENGTHTITWTAPAGIVSDVCSMTATLFTTNVPSGNDYMIVDLNTGAVWYEGLASSQAESNARYNMDLYKGTNTAGECFMVLRKVPRTADSGDLPNGPFAGGYPAGSTTWTTDRAYYIGVFPVTQYQYQKLCASNPSEKISTIPGNVTAHRPVEKVSWDDLRKPSGYAGNFAPTSSIPAVASNSGTFFQRLNYITGNKFGFDLPTEVMFEMSERAGATTVYYWGDTMDTAYVVCSENSGDSTVAVGSRLPNAWGLYDTAGNLFEWCLDDWTSSMTARVDAFTPAWASGTMRVNRGGGSLGNASTGAHFNASYRNTYESNVRYFYVGFRVSMIAE